MIAPGANLSSANLYAADLSFADLSDANLVDANLYAADLTFTDLDSADLPGADLSAATLAFASLFSGVLDDADLIAADLFGATVSFASVRLANLTGANLSGANLAYSSFRDSTLADANLSGADFSHSGFVSADLSGANLSGAQFDDSSQFRWANLTGADLTNTSIHGEFDGADLSGADLTGADLAGLTFSSLEPPIYDCATILPSGFDPVAAGWVEVSSCGVCVEASETIRNSATSPNPIAFQPGLTSGPVVGRTWDPFIDHATFVADSIADFAVVAGGPLDLPLGPEGTLLCDVTTPLLVFASAPAPGAPFVLPVPDNCPLVGLTICAQGGSIDSGGAAHLANALDVTLGTF